MSGERSWLPRLAVWGFPLVTLLVTIAAQFIVPRLIQLKLSEQDYTAYVALTAMAAYVGLGEGGVLISMLRELSALHGAGDRAAFVAEAQRARRVFSFAALLGGAIAAIALATGMLAGRADWLAGHGPGLGLGAFVLVAGAAVELRQGSFHTLLLFSTGRLFLGQVASNAPAVVPVACLIIALLATRDLTTAVWVQAGAVIALATIRGAHARTILAREAAGVTASITAPLARVVGPGALLKLGEVLQNASYPHLLSQIAPALVPSAIPARTYGSAARSFTQQFVNLLQVHITRGLAGDAAARLRAKEQYRAAASFLTSIHLLELGFMVVAARHVFRLWLPNQLAHIDSALPGMIAWQALLAATLPSDILFVAAGQMQWLGIVRLTGTAVGLVTVSATLGTNNYAALGIGLTASAVPAFACGLWGELSRMQDVAPPRAVVMMRYALAAIAAGSAWWMPGRAIAVAGAIAACGTVFLPAAARRLWQLSRA